MRGGYAGHGETYTDPDDLIWWAKGGKLHGEAWQRIGFLRDLIEEDVRERPRRRSASRPGRGAASPAPPTATSRYIYLGEHQPIIWATGLPHGGRRLRDRPHRHLGDDGDAASKRCRRRRTIRPGTARSSAARKPDAAFGVSLPGKPYLAIRVRKPRPSA